MAITCSQSFSSGAFAYRLSVFIVLVLSFVRLTWATGVVIGPDGKKYVQTTTNDGQQVWLADSRKPALYTQNFGDCLGSSQINVTRFDAAYYKDNMTVLFHLEGNTAVANESLMSTLVDSQPVLHILLISGSVYWSLRLRRISVRSNL